MKSTNTFFATCPRGTEKALREELEEIGFTIGADKSGGVSFTGTFREGMNACLNSRIASRILLLLRESRSPDSDALYSSALEIPWEDYFGTENTFAVRATLDIRSGKKKTHPNNEKHGKKRSRKDSSPDSRKKLIHSGFAALKVKDAIVDRFRNRTGKRPNVNTRLPDVLVSVHVKNDISSFYLDLSGEPLHRRGWRVISGIAPLKQNLAAAILRIGRFDPQINLCDPMCGSGTILIEAALMAKKIAPGIGRGFGFERWPFFSGASRDDWVELREAAKSSALKTAPAKIFGKDISDDEIKKSIRNALEAGIKNIHFKRGDARKTEDFPEKCMIFTNPPYGERMGGKHLQLEGFYRQTGKAWSLSSTGRIVVLSGSSSFEKCFGIRAKESHFVYNGSIPCRILVYQP